MTQLPTSPFPKWGTSGPYIYMGNSWELTLCTKKAN